MLTPHQQKEILGVVGYGCDRVTACDYVDCSFRDLADYMAFDPDYRRQIRRAEANAEVKHMKVINEAVTDSKNWRASVWWFERRAPERFARRADVLTTCELENVVDELATAIEETIYDEPMRRELLRKLETFVGDRGAPDDQPLATGETEEA